MLMPTLTILVLQIFIIRHDEITVDTMSYLLGHKKGYKHQPTN